jgi:hypothetical protein
MENKGYIYGLVCPITGEVRYIGLTTQSPRRRLSRHKTEFRTRERKGLVLSHKDRWVKKLAESGLNAKLTMTIVEECYKSQLLERETFWIRHYRSLGANLTNTTDGGGVIPSAELTEEQRLKHVEGVRKAYEERPSIKSRISAGLVEHFANNPKVKGKEAQGAESVYSINLATGERKKFDTHTQCALEYGITKQTLSRLKILKKSLKGIAFSRFPIINGRDYTPAYERPAYLKIVYSVDLKSKKILEYDNATMCANLLGMDRTSAARLARKCTVRKGFLYTYDRSAAERAAAGLRP